jgi:mono/diheme cytochrome c family protein
MRADRVKAACIAALAMIASGGHAAEVTYADVADIFRERCTLCHGASNASLGLRLDSLEGILNGSQRGPVVKAGDPAGSELVRRIKGISQPRMPMTGPPFPAEAQIARIEQWVASGLKPGSPIGGAAPAAPPTHPPEAGGPVTFAHVAPVFAARCAKCHTQQGLMGPAPEGYRLTSYAAVLSSDDRVRVVPGNPAASELVRRIRGQARPRMPMDGPPYLSAEETDLIVAWIKQGARNADGRPAAIPAHARVRLHGNLSRRWALDGLELVTSGSTRIDKSPRTGDYVEVRGRLSPDGAVVAERIRRR